MCIYIYIYIYIVFAQLVVSLTRVAGQLAAGLRVQVVAVVGV